jgi:ADP-heptose:LPS heptosyltransferase/GT2 family glycosyltransferase
VLIHITRPALANGMAVDVVRGSLFVDGYVVAQDGIAAVEIAVDGRYVSPARYAVDANNIVQALAGGTGAAVSRFAAMVPVWALANGRCRVSVAVRTAADDRVATQFAVEVERGTNESDGVALRRKMPLPELQIGGRILAGLAWRPNFGILIGIGEVDAEIASARRTLESLREQVYVRWRATILRRGRVVPERAAARLLDGFADIAARINVQFDVPASAALADLARSGAADGAVDLVGVLLAGDVLGCDALLEMAIASGLQPDAELFYSDEIRPSPVDGKRAAFYKPQWSPALLGSTNYIGRLWCALPNVLRRSGATMGEWFQFGDYDLVLRCTETTSGIHHVPKLLCERGRPLLDHPDQERAALARAVARRGTQGAIADGAVGGSYRVQPATPERPLVSIIIAVEAPDGTARACIESLRAVTAYDSFEVICVGDFSGDGQKAASSPEHGADALVDEGGSSSRSRAKNGGAVRAKGDFLLFLDESCRIVQPRWIEAMLAALRDEVGVVGARVLSADGLVRSGGLYWAPSGARSAFRGLAETASGYFGMALVDRDVIGATSSGLLVRREDFEALGGFAEGHAGIAADLDFCLRCRERGKSIVHAPDAVLVQAGPLAADREGAFDDALFARRWGRKLSLGDPFHHPRLNVAGADLAPEREPIELVYPGRPLFERERIRNILAVKLDHIGDFITALPALRRLQHHFPHARVYLLAAPGVSELSSLASGLAGTIEFGFFFARSGLGQRALSDADFRSLRQRLHPYRFDLAVDFRKAPETRPILLHSGARWLAGFDHNGQFPWLDIVAEWETDVPGVRKRSHIGEDLLRLVDAVATAGETAPDLPLHPGRAAYLAFPAVPGRKRVCVQPGAGSAIRQWPAAHFAVLIDLLAGGYDVEILLVGSEEEADIAEDVMARVERREVVRSLAGKIGLGELPQLLASADLFVGNNSGPKHLAAGLGVPTIGVHSGTVDPREWGPAGTNAVAIRKNMVCSPCYFSDARDCPRDLACLTELQPVDVYELCRRMLAIDRIRR